MKRMDVRGSRKAVLSLLMAAAMTTMTVSGAQESTAQPSADVTQETAEVIDLGMSVNWLSEWSDSAGMYLAEFKYPTMSVTDPELYPKLSAAFDTLNEQWKSQSESSFASSVEDAGKQADEMPEYFYTYTQDDAVAVRRSDTKVVSLLDTMYGFYGGVHGSTVYSSVNIDPNTGQAYALSDVVSDTGLLIEKVKEAVAANYEGLETMSEFAYTLTAERAEELVWNLEYNGLSFHFGSYVLGPYAAGNQSVTIPFAGNETLFNQDFLTVPDSYATSFKEWEPVYTDLTGSGALDEIKVSSERDEYAATTLEVYVNGAMDQYDIYCYDYQPTLIKTPEGTWLYIEMTEDNEFKQTLSIRLTEGGSKLVCTMNLGAHVDVEHPMNDPDTDSYPTNLILDPTDFMLDQRTDLLSTLSAYAHYYVDERGVPMSLNSGDWVTYSIPHDLTTLREVNLTIVDELGQEQGSWTCPQGTTLTMYRTNDMGYVDFKLSDGRLARAYIVTDSWPQTIDGVSTEQIFDGMMFAG